MVVSLLERFGGYTLGTLLEEDAELLRMVRLAEIGRAAGGDDDMEGGGWDV